ncbi:DUF935 family protein [Oleomonas cavernae]|uniref:DUF935 family protein n=1 Tax=Oleomonas cavernae TaxID=2320859 RepID=A0A418WU67_9PROT|nr:DUF935 family protein [Oleomonas cavernae]RJF94814.1 DUF935 family protein [Oleomonas cavernae]
MANPTTQEIATVARDPMVPQFSTTIDPTDATIIARGGGKGLALYDEIKRDPHAFSVLQKRTLEVTSREWTVIEASDRLRDKKAAELVKQQLKGIGFDRLTMGLMGAVLKGYAVAEAMWENRGGVWTVARTKVRKQRRFRFTPEGEPRLLTRESGFDGIELPGRKFVVHRYNVDHDDDEPYGLGLGTVLFWPAWFKRQVLGHWLQASERFAAPTVKATYPGGYDKEKQDKLLASIRAMIRDAGIVVPEGVVIELLEAARGGGGDTQEGLARYLDELMSEAVLGETLSTNSGERGSRSLGEVHNEVRVAIAKADADLVSSTLNDTLVKWIVEVNMPGAGLPQVWRDFSEAEDLDKRAARDKTIYDMGYRPKDAEYINETYGGDWVEKEDEPDEDDSLVVPPPRPEAEFADPQEDDDLAPLVDQLDQAAAPAISAMIARIREQVFAAASYEDLAERLLTILPDIDPSNLAEVMEKAITVAGLAGRNEVSNGN